MAEAGPAASEHELRQRLERGFLGLYRLPPAVEVAYREHVRLRAARLLRMSVYGLAALYLLVVIPISVFSNDASLRTWQLYAMLPIGLVLAALWISTRLAFMDRHVETTLSLALFICLVGTLYCAMLLGNQYYGQIASYESIYILIVVFSVLRLPVQLPLRWSLAAFAQALLIASVQGLPPLWLNMLLYFAVPLLICTVIGYMLEHSDRRDFVQTLCLQMKQRELSLLQEVAEAANEAESLDVALAWVLERICRHAGWPVGHALLADPDHPGGLVASSAWFMRDPERHAPLKGLSDFARRSEVDSIAHRALANGQVVWSNTLSGVDERHHWLQHDGALLAGLALPVKMGVEVVAVLEFFATEALHPDPAQLDAFDHVSIQLARVFERQKRNQERLLHAALHDPLTGLPNRAYLLDHLRRALALRQRRSGYQFAVLFMDVDRFKWVNDSLGHVAGDLLLVEMARRLQECLRPTDIVARLGGDEFAVLVNGIGGIEDAVQAARRIHARLLVPVSLGSQETVISASIGIALGDTRHQQPEDLLRDADTAMYYAKGLGHRGEYAVFADFMQQEASSRLRMTEDLRRAIDSDQLELFYQPIVALGSGHLASFEALLRWRHPEQGLLGPDLFVPLAEETGLIMPLTDWVMRTACDQLARWQATAPERVVGVSVNMCARSFSDPAMPAQIGALLQQSGVQPGSLRLEITESQLMQNANSFASNLASCNAQGIPVYIDDFGTGYSSLSYLTSFNVSALKIDRSFVERLGSGEREAVIVRTIVALAHHLGMTVIAEGVETPAQLEFLRGLECQFGQGYLFSRPLDATAVDALLRQPALLPAGTERVLDA